MSSPLAIPTVHGPLVTLRTHRPEDAAGVHERCVDADTVRFTTVPTPYTLAMAQEYVASMAEPSPQRISWAIEVDGAYAGTIDLRALEVDAGAGDLGFVTHPAFRGRGVMTEAVRLVVAHALDTLGWQLVRWTAHAGNWASAKTVWHVGFSVPAFAPDLLVERGRVADGWIASLRAGAPREPVAPWAQVQAALGRA